MRDVVQDLQSWFLKHCDGNWEHQYGVKIETLDNPGWAVEVELTGTPLSEIPYRKMIEERSENDWISCFVEQDIFKGYGGPQNLLEILNVFLEWVERSEQTDIEGAN